MVRPNSIPMRYQRTPRWFSSRLITLVVLMLFTRLSFGAENHHPSSNPIQAKPFGIYQEMLALIGWGKTVAYFVCYYSAAIIPIWILSKRLGSNRATFATAAKYSGFQVFAPIVGSLAFYFVNPFIDSLPQFLLVALCFVALAIFISFHVTMSLYDFGIGRALLMMLCLSVSLGCLQISIGMASGCPEKTPFGASLNRSFKRQGITLFPERRPTEPPRELVLQPDPVPATSVASTPPPSPLRAKYEELLAARQHLDSNDPAAVARFNELVAEYNAEKAKAGAVAITPAPIAASPAATPVAHRRKQAKKQ